MNILRILFIFIGIKMREHFNIGEFLVMSQASNNPSYICALAVVGVKLIQ